MVDLEFPIACVSFGGPHSLDCLISLWIGGGCVMSGWKNPNNLTGPDVSVLKHMDLK